MRECEICGQAMPQYNMFSNKDFCNDCAGDNYEVEVSPLPNKLKLVIDNNIAAIHFSDQLLSEVSISEVPVVKGGESYIDLTAMRISQSDAEYLVEVLYAFVENGYLPGKLDNNKRKG